MTTTELVRIGSRGSELALWQAKWVQRALVERVAGIRVEIEIIKTKGDRILDSPLSKIGDRGLFTREIENALLDGRIDLAVHSLKDLPTELPGGLMIGAVCEREDVRDVFIPHPRNPAKKLLDQPAGSQIATGSLRRRSQLLHARPDFQVADLRGNLNTRVRKLEESGWAGMILARAGVVRLGWDGLIGETLDADIMLPAVGQGALAIETRDGDQRVISYVSRLHHEVTACSVRAERALLHRLDGGCQIPIGAYGRPEENDEELLLLDAVVGSLDGRKVVRGSVRGASTDAETLGRDLAERLLANGGDAILQEIRRASTVNQNRAIDV